MNLLVTLFYSLMGLFALVAGLILTLAPNAPSLQIFLGASLAMIGGITIFLAIFGKENNE